MEHLQHFWPRWFHHLVHCITLIAAMATVATASAAQDAPANSPEASLSPDLQNYPGLLPEIGKVLDKMQREIQFPAPRNKSRLLPLLPDSSIFYAAVPNYGEASHQALMIFQRELQARPVLRAWWQHGKFATDGPKVESSMEKFYQLSQYLGDEIVVSAAAEGGKDPDLLIVAQVRKPGLKEFLQQLVAEFATKSTPAVRVLDVRELASARDTTRNTTKDGTVENQLVFLVRPDFVVAGFNVKTLRSLNVRLDDSHQDFASTPFGTRMEKTYEGDGATVLAGADLEKILSKIPHGSGQDQIVLKRTGFDEVKYLVWEHKHVADHSESQVELSFTGPRHGVASWLAAPGPVNSLEFVSPKAIMAGAVRLKNPVQIFDDYKELATASNPNALAPISLLEGATKLSVRDDLLGLLGGEIAFELGSVAPPTPAWKVIAQVNDPVRLQKTLGALLALSGVTPRQIEEEGVTYYNLRIPSGQKTTEITYAFADGYLIVASSQQTVTDSIHLHQSGESLAKSKKLLDAMPSGHLTDVSAVFYEDPLAFTALTMRQAPPEVAELFNSLLTGTVETPPVVICGYGEESVLREVSRSGGADVGGILIAAAIAIPNVLRARTAANESSAVASLRIINTAQISYASEYPQNGFARDLAMLGPDPGGTNTGTPEHASLIDSVLGNSDCTAVAWCTKSGYRFSVASTCEKKPCRNFVAVATPVASTTGTRNFCSASDAVIRSQVALPLSKPTSRSECQTWTPLQ